MPSGRGKDLQDPDVPEGSWPAGELLRRVWKGSPGLDLTSGRRLVCHAWQARGGVSAMRRESAEDRSGRLGKNARAVPSTLADDQARLRQAGPPGGLADGPGD